LIILVVEHQRAVQERSITVGQGLSRSLHFASAHGPAQSDSDYQDSSLNFGPSIVQSIADLQSAQRSDTLRKRENGSSGDGSGSDLKGEKVKNGSLSFGPSIIQSIADLQNARHGQRNTEHNPSSVHEVGNSESKRMSLPGNALKVWIKFSVATLLITIPV
jgi:hypothetical protein